MPDLTSVEIVGKDSTGPAFSSVRRGLDGLGGATDVLRSRLAALGGVFSVGVFAAAFKSIVDMADQLDDLSQKTGASVEELSRFAGVARVTGQDLGAVESSMARLARALVEAQAGGNDAARAFQAFGINIRDAHGNLRTSGDVMAELARRQQDFADGSGKAAAMMALLGRSGADLIPFLNDYVEYSGDIVEINGDAAAAAGKLNDQLGLLSEEFNVMLRERVMPLIPAMTDLARSTREVAKAFGETLPGGNIFEDILQSISETNRRTVAEINYLTTLWDGFRKWWKEASVLDIAQVATGNLAKFAQEMAQARARADAAYRSTLIQQENEALARAVRELPPLLEATAKAAGKAGVAFRGASGEAAKFKDEMNAHVKAYEEWLEAEMKLRTSLGGLKHDVDAMNEAWNEAARALERVAGFQQATNDEVTRARSDLGGLVREMELEADLLTMTERQRAERLLELQLERHEITLTADELEKYRARFMAAFDRREATTQSMRFYDDLRDAAAGFFEDFLNNGSAAFKNLWESFKRWALSALAQVAAQRVVVSISGAFGGGGFGGSPAGNILGGGLGGLFSGFEGLPGFVGPLQPGTFGAGLSSFFQGASSPLSTFGTLFGGGGLAAIGGIGGLLGAALPIVGIGAALASAFGLFDRGGPKAGGSASSLADILGGTTGLGTLERLFTPNQRDADVQTVTDSIATSFLSVARSLGIAGGTAQFGLGFDTDPEGDAGNRVSALATLNGQTVYQVTDRDLGRDGDVTAALEEEAKRALFAALQASEMPAYLANLFDGIDAAGATAEQIDGILQTAAALKIAVDAISGLGDQFAALDPADVQGFVEAFGGLEGLLQRVAYIGENFYTDAERLAQATTRLEESFDALGIAVPQTHQAFLALLNGLDLTTAEGREMYEAISALAPLFVEVRGTAQQAADALEDAAGALDEVAQAASNIIDLGSLSGTVYGEANSAIARIIDLAGTLGGSIGEQLTAQINLANGEIQRYVALWQQAQPGSAESQALLEIIGILQQFNQGTAAALAQYTSIVAQYGSEYADAIYQLQQQYWQQTQLFQGNTQALSALAIWYNEQLQAILEGTAEGVTGTISELDRLRESLQDYLAGLSLRSDLSPLSPAARLAEAQRQYQDLLARAQGGDVDALRDLQGAADAYLRIAREMFASGADYTNIFQSVVDALSVLSAPPQTGGPEPRPDALIAAALPTDSRLASQDDIEWLAAQVIAAIREGSREQADATVRGSERVAIASRPLK